MKDTIKMKKNRNRQTGRRRRRHPVWKAILWLIVLVGLFYGLTVQPLVRILPVPVLNQHPDFPTGCESVSLTMLLRYYGVQVSTETIIDQLPKGSVPYEVDGRVIGGNPEREFVGDPRNAESFGVYQIPICDTAELFQSGAHQMSGALIDTVREILRNGDPVLAWYTTDSHRGIEYKYSWIDEETGEVVHWPSREHAVVITGYAPGFLFFNDPNTGSFRAISVHEFQKDFSAMGGRIVWYEEGFQPLKILNGWLP